MSYTEEPLPLVVEDFPSKRQEQEYVQNRVTHNEYNHELEPNVPHKPFESQLFRIDLTLELVFDANLGHYTGHLSKSDMAAFASAHGSPGAIDLSRTIVKELNLVGMGQLNDPAAWHVSVTDNTAPRSKPLFKKGILKTHDNKLVEIGVPVARTIAQPCLWRSEAEHMKNIERFANFRMEMLTDGVSSLPSKRNPVMLVPIYPNGLYFYHALVEQNRILPNLQTNQEGEEEYYKIRPREYEAVVNAYQAMVNKIESQMHDLSAMTVVVKPFNGNKIVGAVSGTKPLSCLMQLDCYLSTVS